MSNFVFFLGGQDLEMRTIRTLLETYTPGLWYDKNLGWNARSSAYREEIAACLDAGKTPVLVELADDLGWVPERIVVVDHHGVRAGKDRPTSLHQVFDLLELPPAIWTRRYDLVAANDRGYIPALLELGATPAEIAAIRAEDRAAQGVTPEQEAQATAAVRALEVLAGGELTLVRLPHSRTSAVTDRLDPVLGGPGCGNLLVRCPDETAFFGAGRWVVELDQAFPGGWYGGALPERGFWGINTVPEQGGMIEDFLIARLQRLPRTARNIAEAPKFQARHSGLPPTSSTQSVS